MHIVTGDSCVHEQGLKGQTAAVEAEVKGDWLKGKVKLDGFCRTKLLPAPYVPHSRLQPVSIESFK